MNKSNRQRPDEVVPSFLSPFDTVSGRRQLHAPAQGNATPVIIDYWRLAVRERRKLLIPVVATALVAFIVGLRSEPVYQATSTLMFESNTKGPVSIQEVGGNVPALVGGTDFLQTSEVALRVIRHLNLAENPEFVGDSGGVIGWLKGMFSSDEGQSKEQLEQKALEYFHDHLSVRQTHLNPLVAVSFESKDPVLAAAIVNEVPTAFIRADMDARYAATQAADQWLTDRLAQLKANLDRSEQALAVYRTENGIIARSSDEASEQQISMLNQRLLDARARLLAAEEAYKLANSKDLSRVLAAPGIATNPAVIRARQAQSEAQARMAELRSQLGTAHPQYRRANSELNQAQQDLMNQVATARREIAGELAAARASEQQLVETLDTARKGLSSLDGKEITARQLEQEVDTNRQLYQTFLTRVKEVTAAGDFQRPAARLIDAAQVPTEPVKPQKLLMTALGALLGLLGGFFAIVLMDQIRNTLRRTDDVEDKLDRHLLAAIPKLPAPEAAKAPSMQLLKPESLFAESIRTLSTTVLLAGLERNIGVLAVSSALDGEGKTSVACNLAVAMSATRRVLLIDCDLRWPSVMNGLGMSNGAPGLVQLLTGRASLDQCIKPVQGSSLKVIGAGRAAGNALDLLVNAQFDDLLTQLQHDFDTIILDCPPVQLVSDGLILGRSASSMVFVARSDSTPLPVIRRALQRLDKAGISVLGVALNAHDFAQADRFYGENSGYAAYGYDKSYGAAKRAAKQRGGLPQKT
ncbi:MAG: polysaccharide biosynthesis tyrosine autokinase [Lautropia sp.]|nr:polysaccharide biosynthesis tyrosine autokinase [Lautropia sp.]